MAKNFKQLFPTLEEKSSEIESGNPELTAVTEVQLIESEKEGVELDKLVEVAEGGAAAQDQLNTLAGYVESAEKRGGMSPALAQVVAFTHECIVSRLGYTTKGKNPTARRAVASLEGFKKEDTRKQETHYTAESLREQAKELGNRALEMIRKIWAQIRSYMSKLFSAKIKSDLKTNLASDKAAVTKLKSQDVGTRTMEAKGYFADYKTLADTLASVDAELKKSLRILELPKISYDGEANIEAIAKKLKDALDSEQAVHPLMKGTDLIAIITYAEGVLMTIDRLNSLTAGKEKPTWMANLVKSEEDAEQTREALRAEAELVRTVVAPAVRMLREVTVYAKKWVRVAQVRVMIKADKPEAK